MTIDEAFTLVKNFDYSLSRRRFAPKHGLVQFNSSGEIVSVYRFRETPHEKEQYEALAAHPGCLQISTMPDWFETADELKTRIERSLWLFSHMKRRGA
jgi:hypothetical protein